jgi:hypothetical protein
MMSSAPKRRRAVGDPIMRALSVVVLAAAILAALPLSGCATVERVDAAADVHEFLVSIRDDDRGMFDRHVDRRALKLQLETRIIQETQSRSARPEVRAIGALLARPVADALGSTLIRPGVFRAVAVSLGYSPYKPLPKRLSIAAALRPTGPGRVCASKSKTDPCLLTFAREDDVWRLVGFDGAISQLKL